MTTAHSSLISAPGFPGVTVHRNPAVAALIEMALRRGEGQLASNGAIVCDTGERTGRSPADKFLEDTPAIHGAIDWGRVNQPISPENFSRIEALALEHLGRRTELFCFQGFAGADPAYRLKVTVIAEEAWHCLFARTLFIDSPPPTGAAPGGGGPPADDDEELEAFDAEQGEGAGGGPRGLRGRPPGAGWTIINACNLKMDDYEDYGLRSPLCILQSLARKKVIIIGTRYAGEIKKSIFYAMNYDLPEMGVFPMHCSANVGKTDEHDVALFFGLSGTGKTTLSADPQRMLIGDDEHGWSDRGVFNIEGGCYAKCIKLSQEGEPQIFSAIRFGSVLENVIIDPETREPDYDDASKTENTRVTYPVSYIDNAVIPSVAGHPKNVIFLTADAYGVLPPVAKLTPEQAMYYFINGYTSKLAGTEAGVTEPVPNFSACFGGPFLPRPAMVYAQMLAERIRKHDAHVWLLNTGWTGGPYGVGRRFKLQYTRTFVTSILDGSLRGAEFHADPVFGLHVPRDVPNVPREVLMPRNTWADPDAYDAKAGHLAGLFRQNDAKYEIDQAVRAAGPTV